MGQLALKGSRGLAELWPRLEAIGDDLVGCPSLEDTLTPRVVGDIESAKQLLEVAVRVDGDAWHLATDAAVAAFDHAIRLRCAIART